MTSPDEPAEVGAEPVPDHDPTILDDASLSNKVANVLEDVADVAFTGTLSGDEADTAVGLTAGAIAIEAPVREATTKRSGRTVQASPVLSLPRAKHPEAVALFVHGGDVTGYLRMTRADPAYMRVVPFARDVERRSHGRIGGALLRLAVRGWNDPEKPALEDTRWALKELRRHYPGLPLALVGHSMGGRVVLEIAAEDDIDAVVALAPWASDEYDGAPYVGTPLLALHGGRDRVTEHDATRDLVERINAAGGSAEFVSMPFGHSMIVQANQWHRRTSQFLIRSLLEGHRSV